MLQKWKTLKGWQKTLIVIFLIMGLIGAISEDKEPSQSPKTDSAKARVPEVKPTPETKPVPKTFDQADVTEEAVSEVATEKLGESAAVKVVKSTMVEGKYILEVTYNMGNQRDENTALKSFTRQTVSVFKVYFSNPAVMSVRLDGQTSFLDPYGNSSTDSAMWVTWDRELAAKVDWENFPGMVLTDPTLVFQHAEYRWIHPAVYKKLDSEYQAKLGR